MRAQFTLKQETMDALALRAEYAEITISRLVEYVLTQWLLKNEAVVLLTGDARPSVSAPPLSQPSVTHAAPSSTPAPASSKELPHWHPSNLPGPCPSCKRSFGLHEQDCPAKPKKTEDPKPRMQTFKERFGRDAKVTREHGDPMCLECGNLLPEDQIGPDDIHPSCLGYSPSAV